MRISSTWRSVLTILVVLSTSTASASSYDPDDYDQYQDDAGSGGDAGDDRASALVVQLSSSLHAAAVPQDVDWFAASSMTSAPSCVVATVSAQHKDLYVRIGSEIGSAIDAAATLVPRGATTRAGLAVIPNEVFTLRATPVNQGTAWWQGATYDLRLDEVGVPSPSAGDALSGSDAGGSMGSSIPIEPGCVGGHLGASLFDSQDIYAITIPAGQMLTYSLAGAPGVSLTAFDDSGLALGPTIGPGEVASASSASGGTYYLSASSAGVGDLGYLVGVVLGPPGCQPYC